MRLRIVPGAYYHTAYVVSAPIYTYPTFRSVNIQISIYYIYRREFLFCLLCTRVVCTVIIIIIILRQSVFMNFQLQFNNAKILCTNSYRNTNYKAFLPGVRYEITTTSGRWQILLDEYWWAVRRGWNHFEQAVYSGPFVLHIGPRPCTFR